MFSVIELNSPIIDFIKFYEDAELNIAKKLISINKIFIAVCTLFMKLCFDWRGNSKCCLLRDRKKYSENDL